MPSAGFTLAPQLKEWPKDPDPIWMTVLERQEVRQEVRQELPGYLEGVWVRYLVGAGRSISWRDLSGAMWNRGVFLEEFRL